MDFGTIPGFNLFGSSSNYDVQLNNDKSTEGKVIYDRKRQQLNSIFVNGAAAAAARD